MAVTAASELPRIAPQKVLFIGVSSLHHKMGIRRFVAVRPIEASLNLRYDEVFRRLLSERAFDANCGRK
jgi:hypothetical protein